MRKINVLSKYTLVNAAPSERVGPRIVFLHVPKTAGTTIRYIIEGVAARKGWRCANEARIGVESFMKLDHEASDCFLGHSHLDWYHQRDASYTTVFRDPLERLNSLFRFRNDRSSEPISEEDFARTIGPASANAHCALLSGILDDDRMDEALAVAKARIENGVAFFGFQDRLAEYAALLAGLLGIEGIIFPRIQVSAARTSLGDRMIREFETACRHDIELYEHARALYSERTAGLFDGDWHTARRHGVEYLSVKLDEASRAIAVGGVVFAQPAEPER